MACIARNAREAAAQINAVTLRRAYALSIQIDVGPVVFRFIPAICMWIEGMTGKTRGRRIGLIGFYLVACQAHLKCVLIYPNAVGIGP